MHALIPSQKPVATLVRSSVPQSPRIASELTKPEVTLRLDTGHLASMIASNKAPDIANLLTALSLTGAGLTMDPVSSFG